MNKEASIMSNCNGISLTTYKQSINIPIRKYGGKVIQMTLVPQALAHVCVGCIIMVPTPFFKKNLGQS